MPLSCQLSFIFCNAHDMQDKIKTRPAPGFTEVLKKDVLPKRLGP